MPDSYSSAHRNATRKRGHPSTLECVSCGNKAYDWALKPELHVSGSRTYSMNADDYDPMCRSCHVKQDTPPDVFEVRAANMNRGWNDLTPEERLAARQKGGRVAGLVNGPANAAKWAEDPSTHPLSTQDARDKRGQALAKIRPCSFDGCTYVGTGRQVGGHKRQKHRFDS
jgi:hypothetical protein